MLIDHEAIQKAKEALGDHNAELIQDLLQMDRYDSKRKVGCCPNPNHEDTNPSCSYNKNTFQFHCFSCGYNVDFLAAYMEVNNCSFTEACKQLFHEAGIMYDFTHLGTSQRKRDYRYPKPKYSESKTKVYEYWASRGISKETIDYLDIQQDINGCTLFQYYDINDSLVSVKVRLSRQLTADEKEKHRPKTWYLKDCNGNPYDHMDVLYNMNKVNPEQPLIITCGEGDAASCIEAGFKNTVSVNGGDQNVQWISECWEWLQQFDEIVLVPDNDDAGRKFAKTVSVRLGEYRVKIADVSRYVIQELGKDETPANDLNDVLSAFGADAVQELIKDAKETEIPSIVDYSDVKKFDMSEVPGFISGLTDMDNALDKFYLGSATVLTGIAGSGKSSLLSTLICQSVEQGFPVFVYSGELSNPSLKNWVDFVHAGRRGLQEYQKMRGDGFYYRLKPDTYSKINETYRGQIFFYKDSFDQKVTNIMNAAECVVRRYGVKTLVFDNMTSMDLENNDDNKYQKQEEFIRNIIAFASRWNVCCIIVLHPKKMDMNRRMNLFDLQGSSSAVNLAHRVLALYRVPPKEKAGVPMKSGGYVTQPVPYDVTIEVLKDRFGSGTNKTIGLFYDVPSKRFYDSQQTLDFQYKWDTTNYGDAPLPYGETALEKADREEEEVYSKRIINH